MKQNSAPLWSALVAYDEAGVTPFHTPGHKLMPGPFKNIEAVLGPGFFKLDPSDEIENLELNHDFEIALNMAEKLAAKLFGSKDTLFLVNGTTGGLHYLLMPTRGTVVIPRFSHQAVYSAMMLSQGQATYVPASYDPDWLIPLPPKVDEIEDIFSKSQPEALVLTHPTYYGTVSELAAITNLARARNTLVFVDEAHGGHFRFSDDLPATGLESGADAVVQSTHKTLGSFTQTSMLHSNNASWFLKAVQAKQVLQTTSPSLVFLAVLDEVRRVLAQQGQELVEKALQLANNCVTKLRKIPYVELLPSHLQSDPTKIVFSLRKLGLTGIDVERILRLDYNIQVELSDYYNVLALITVGDDPRSVSRLVDSINDLVARKAHLGGPALKRLELDFPELPPIALSLREGFFMEKETVSLQEAVGRISGGFLTPYPPGVPVIAPGEQFTDDIIQHLIWCLKINWPVRGLLAGQKVVVLKD